MRSCDCPSRNVQVKPARRVIKRRISEQAINLTQLEGLTLRAWALSEGLKLLQYQRNTTKSDEVRKPRPPANIVPKIELPRNVEAEKAEAEFEDERTRAYGSL
eukprot:787502_1